MSLKKWILPLSCVLLLNQINAASTEEEIIQSAQQALVKQSEIQNCRLVLQGFSSNNPDVLKMFEQTVGQWEAYYLHVDKNFDLSSLLKAITFAAIKHEGQCRKDAFSTPYIIHPIGVARSLWEEGQVRDTNILLAALLHDTLEDTETTSQELEQEFGSLVRATVEELTNDPQLSSEGNKQRQVDHAPHMSPNAKVVKLADRLYNIRDLKNLPQGWSEEKIKDYLVWGQKLLKALEGTNEYLENALQQEIAAQTSL